jgi:hypothetical protein
LPAPSLGSPEAAAADDDNVIEAIHVGKNSTDLFLPVMIDGQKWWFVVDTGCSETVVDCEVAIHVHLMERHEKPDRWRGIQRTLNASVGNSRLPLHCRATCFDLSHLRRCHRSFPLCGILGMDFLRSYVIGIELDAGKFSFFKSVPESSGNQFKLSRDSYDRPLVRVAIAEDNDAWFVVDTGWTGPEAGAIDKPLFTDLVAKKHMSGFRSPVERMTFYGRRRCKQASLDVFQLGSFEHLGLNFVDARSDNLLGLGYLSRYVVTLDFPNDLMYLKQGDRYADPPDAAAPYASIRKGDAALPGIGPAAPSSKAGLPPVSTVVGDQFPFESFLFRKAEKIAQRKAEERHPLILSELGVTGRQHGKDSDFCPQPANGGAAG